MPRFAANLTMLFTELPFLERFKAAAEAGFGAVEFMFPYEFADARHCRGARRTTASSSFSIICRPATGRRGDRGIACQPDRVAEFRDGVMKAIEYADGSRAVRSSIVSPESLPRGVTAETGPRRAGREPAAMRREKLEAAKIGLLLEPVNSRDIPGFFVDRPSLGLSHPRRDWSKEPQAAVRHLPCAGHGGRSRRAQSSGSSTASGTSRSPTIPAATSPEPARSTIRSYSAAIDELGYDGWIGCEYKPLAATKAGPLMASLPIAPGERPERYFTGRRSKDNEQRSASSVSASWDARWPATCSRAATSSSFTPAALRRRSWRTRARPRAPMARKSARRPT